MFKPGFSHSRFAQLAIAAAVCCCALLSFFCLPASAQAEFTRLVNETQVFDIEGEALPFPFIGGITSPRPQLVDIDADGDLDLFMQMDVRRLEYFEYIGGETQQWAWRGTSWMGIDIGSWYTFVDVDGDQDYDLMCGGPQNGFRLFRNIGTPQVPEFEVATDRLLDTEGMAITPGGQQSVPAWADIDCDGDADLFLGDVDGTITFYQYIGLDSEGLPRYQLETTRYQDLFIVTNGTRKQGGTDESSHETKHGENVLTFVDIDGDNDQDFIWGDFFAGGILLFENTGDCQNAIFTNGDVRFPRANPIETEAFNIPRFGDVDGDGDQDMIVGILDGAFGSADAGPGLLYFFDNEGTPQTPNFVQRTPQLIRTVDIGEAAVPAIVDLTGDGKPEILLGNEALPDNIDRGTLTYIEQVNGDLRIIDSDYFGIDVGNNLSPTHADLDDDGDSDLVLGHWNGRLTYLENIGNSSQPFFEVRDLLASFDIGTYSSPNLVDVDGDDDYDLVIGSFNGRLALLRNTGTQQAPNFELEDKNYLGFDFSVSSRPAFGDIDNDNIVDMLVGTLSEGVKVYLGVGPEFGNFVEDTENYNFDFYLRAAPSLGDIDADGDLDLLIGTSNGGLIYYRNDLVINSVADGIPQTVPMTVRPQPAQAEQLILEFTLDANSWSGPQLTLEIVDISGRTLLRSSVGVTPGNNTLELAGLPGIANLGQGTVFLRLLDGQTILASTSTIVLP